MTHANAPLTPTGRLRMVQRHLHDGIPQAHVAAEFRVSRPTVATWVARYRAEGEAGLLDRPSRPRRSPAQLDPEVVAQIQTLRRREKWSARRITTTSSPRATGCASERWAGGCTGWASPGCQTSRPQVRTCANDPRRSPREGRGTWCTWM